jgi:hypothetical protein
MRRPHLQPRRGVSAIEQVGVAVDEIDQHAAAIFAEHGRPHGGRHLFVRLTCRDGIARIAKRGVAHF